VLTVAALCAVALLLFFIQQGRRGERLATLAIEDSSSIVDSAILMEDDKYDEELYYLAVAEQYASMIPADKVILARLIDTVNHHIAYCETGYRPSCYLFDLETLTTEVIFGGDNGFYADTKLLIVDSIRAWRLIDNNVYFVATNGAPGSSYVDSTLVFSVDLQSRRLSPVDVGTDAYFRGERQLLVGHASLLYRSFFTGEAVYSETVTTVNL